MDICVIGLGSMGKRRIRLLKAIDPDFVIVGIDKNAERRKIAHERYGIECYFSLDEINIRFDCMFVCTPPDLHGRIIRECLEKEAHIFSEINLVNDLYEENIQLADEKQKILFLSSTPMYRDEIIYIDAKVKQNGKKCAYQYHVGQYLPDWHPWDDLKDFFVSYQKTNGCREYLAIELPWIQNTFGKIKDINVIKRKLTGLGLRFPDTYMIQIEHVDGNVGNLVIDVVSRHPVRHLEVFNEEIYLRWDGIPGSLYEKDLYSGELKKIHTGKYVHEDGYADLINEYAYEKEIREFFAVIQGGKPIYDFKKDLETLKVIDMIEDGPIQ